MNAVQTLNRFASFSAAVSASYFIFKPSRRLHARTESEQK